MKETSVYDIITQKVIALLEVGTIPWQSRGQQATNIGFSVSEWFEGNGARLCAERQ